MGFFDKIVSKVRRTTASGSPVAPAAQRTTGGSALSFLAPSKPPGGPLDLVKGDVVIHYRERFELVGLRELSGEGPAILHYCLRDTDGAAAVIACEGGGGLTLQRAVKAQVAWDAEEITGIADEPFRRVTQGRMKVRTWDDAGIATGTRSMEFRRFADASGERVIALEDYQGKREIRVGEPVFEAEMEFERGAPGRTAGARTAALSAAGTFEDRADDEVVKGTPRAAARALEQNMGSARLGAKPAPADHDPTAYDDDEWADADDDAPAMEPARAKVAAKSSDDDDEWITATQLVRENGDVGGDDDA